MTEYELLRIENIKRNTLYLKELGLTNDEKTTKPPTTKKRKNAAAVVDVVERPQRKKTLSISLPIPSSTSVSSNQIKIKSIESLLAMAAFPFAETKTAAMFRIGDSKSNFKFSKLSGIQSFSNAIVLFVNMDGESYANVVSGARRRLIWFAQARQSIDSPVIARIVGGDCDVLLVVRFVGEPYHFLGRVSVESCIDADARPMAFRLQLLDRSLPTMQHSELK